MNEILDAFVTINAIELGVNGLVEGVRREEQSDHPVANFAGGVRIQMAIKAIGVGELFSGEKAGLNEAKAECEQNGFYARPHPNSLPRGEGEASVARSPFTSSWCRRHRIRLR